MRRHESEVEGETGSKTWPSNQQLDGAEGREEPPRELVMFLVALFLDHSEITNECQLQRGKSRASLCG